ncbi:MAG: SAM-dependent methyltransferase, partial [Paracoccaceae bacterium]
MADRARARTTTKGEGDLPRWFGAVFDTVQRIEVGSFSFVLPDGREFRAEGSCSGPAARVEVRDPAFFGRLIRDGELGFAES